MENYKKRIYTNYATNHTNHLYGEETLNTFKNSFSVWRYYYYKLLPKNLDSKILDIGCGKGSFVFFLNSLGYKNAAGIDISQEQIHIGKSLGIANIECTDIESALLNCENYYDCIIARDVMEHFTKQEIYNILIMVKKALKSNGSFIMQSPNGEGLFFSHIYFGDFTHETVFSRNSLNQIFKTIGFVEMNYYSMGPVPKGLKSAIRFLLWKGIENILKLLKLIQTGSGAAIFTQNIIAKAHVNNKQPIEDLSNNH